MLPILLAVSLVQRRVAFSHGGHGYVVKLNASVQPAVTVWRDGRKIWSGIRRSWKPWKIEITDVDRDGRPDFAVGLVKGTQYLPKPHNCLFVYGINGAEVHPKWRGSSLGQPFFDYAFLERPGTKPLLVTVNSRLDGKRCLVGYTWSGFGFAKQWQKGEWKALRIVRVDGAAAVVVADGKELRIGLDDE